MQLMVKKYFFHDENSTKDDFRLAVLILSPGLFLSGLACMSAYYLFFHPSGKMPDRSTKAPD